MKGILTIGGHCSQQLGWWGAMGIETIRDPRDGQDKLMEDQSAVSTASSGIA